MNAMLMIGRLDTPWQKLEAKGTGKPFFKNVLRGKSSYDNAAGEKVEKEWAVELIAFGHMGNSLNAHTGAGDLVAMKGQLQSNERESQDGTRTYISNSMQVVENQIVESAGDSDIPF